MHAFACIDSVQAYPLASPAFRIVAARALVAALDADEGGLAAFRALREATALVLRQVHHFTLDQLGRGAALGRQEADVDEMALDDVADRGEQRGHIAPLHPGAAARVEHRFQFLDDEAHITAEELKAV